MSIGRRRIESARIEFITGDRLVTFESRSVFKSDAHSEFAQTTSGRLMFHARTMESPFSHRNKVSGELESNSVLTVRSGRVRVCFAVRFSVLTRIILLSRSLTKVECELC